ncbi:hypothetical protein [Streptomyces sp. BV129]|uniref:hypothetical protein n=1 Tax=Streptomyces sp. BV129 TaxID=2849671 RepID=UPI001C2E2791|nr:hypothetical protein [Streptomyces sp. BV129]MBV1945442.1 hypothetical protein [Streptomyces sp. BV129]
MLRSSRVTAVGLSLLWAVSACSAGTPEEDAGIRAAEVCGKFAHESYVESALAKISGTARFSDNGSEPEKALAALRAADGKIEDSEMEGVPNCLLRPPPGGEHLVTISVREAAIILQANPESEKMYTYYRTGASASSSDRFTSIYFRCRMANPKKNFIVNASLERESRVKLPGKEAADKQMIVANAAAKSVAQQLGCKGTNLSKGAPEAISGVYGPR